MTDQSILTTKDSRPLLLAQIPDGAPPGTRWIQPRKSVLRQHVTHSAAAVGSQKYSNFGTFLYHGIFFGVTKPVGRGGWTFSSKKARKVRRRYDAHQPRQEKINDPGFASKSRTPWMLLKLRRKSTGASQKKQTGLGKTNRKDPDSRVSSVVSRAVLRLTPESFERQGLHFCEESDKHTTI